MRQLMIAVAIAIGLAALGGRAEAGLVVNIEQVGANVVTTGSGSIDLSVLTQVGTGGIQPLVFGQFGWVFVGPLGGGFVYTGLSGPSSFGTGGLITPTPSGSGTGDSFGIEASGNSFGSPVLYLPFGYASGSMLSGSSTYDNTTIAALGLMPGSYTYAPSGIGTSADNSFTINIGSVPEPSSLTMAATALGMCGALALRCRGRTRA